MITRYSIYDLYRWCTILRFTSDPHGFSSPLPSLDRAQEAKSALNFLLREAPSRWNRQLSHFDQLVTLVPSSSQALHPLIDTLRRSLAAFSSNESSAARNTLSATFQDIDETSLRAFRSLRLAASQPDMRSRLHLLDKPLSYFHASHMSLRVLHQHHEYLQALLVSPPSLSPQDNPLLAPLLPQLARKFSLTDLIAGSVEYVRGFSVEKHGISPQISFHAPSSVDMVGIEPLVQFAIVELLKNAVQAVLDHHAFDIDLVENAVVHVACALDPSHTACLSIADPGAGIAPSALPLSSRSPHEPCIFDWFYSTVEEPPETYINGQHFGLPFSGQGVGLPLSRVYARCFGGDLSLMSLPGKGSTAYLYLDTTGLKFSLLS